MTNKKPHIKPTTKHRNQNILNKFYNAYIKSKNNTNKQIIPTHKRDNENCDIADKKEYEVNLDKKYFLINFSCFRET